MSLSARSVPSFSGVLTPAAATRLGVLEAANQQVGFDKTEDGKYAKNIHFNGEFIGSEVGTISLGPDGIIENS